MEPTVGPPNAPGILAALADYRKARTAFLEMLGCPTSNRDALAELSERLVAALMGGTLPESRVQRGWDVLAGQERIQVRYLANPADGWVNAPTCAERLVAGEHPELVTPSWRL